LRRLGSPEVVTENPRVGSSILSLGTIIKSSRVIALELFMFEFVDLDGLGGVWKFKIILASLSLKAK
jgi:hypothetical protein